VLSPLVSKNLATLHGIIMYFGTLSMHRGGYQESGSWAGEWEVCVRSHTPVNIYDNLPNVALGP
jgi:hypothetical protein